ncbi:MAG: DUF2029 domain-containing protein [Ferrovum sp.]|nr:DUF2029 domain-containing protein [Ferrovum sp.]
MLAFFLAIAFGLVWFSNLVDPKGYDIISDLAVFWSASHLALASHASDAYLLGKIREVDSVFYQNVQTSFGWFYPPSFYLLILPLGLLPYIPAYLVFMLPTLIFYVFVVRSIIWNREVIWILASFSGVWLNLLRGQNGFLTAGLAGLALLHLEKRPVFAGVAIGLLSIKPHLVLMFPVALIAIGAWRTLIVAFITALGVLAAGMGVLGMDTLSAWIHSLDIARQYTESNGPEFWVHMPTIFAFCRLLGVSIAVSYITHIVVALGAVCSVWWVWRHCHEHSLRAAMLTTATLLISPYVLEYDLAWLALPMAWVSSLALRQGWLRGERETMVLAWILPLLCVVIAKTTSIQIGPWGVLLLGWIILRRTWVLRKSSALPG